MIFWEYFVQMQIIQVRELSYFIAESPFSVGSWLLFCEECYVLKKKCISDILTENL